MPNTLEESKEIERVRMRIRLLDAIMRAGAKMSKEQMDEMNEAYSFLRSRNLSAFPQEN